jgi:glycosyltransferase involved in cell wall biosynthesis
VLGQLLEHVRPHVSRSEFFALNFPNMDLLAAVHACGVESGRSGDKFLTDVALAAMGRYRGGSAKVAVVSSSLFGTVSGSAVSNVVVEPAPEEYVARRLRGGTGEKAFIAFGLIGTLHGRLKGIQTLLTALSEVRHQLPAFIFRVLGGGDQRPWQDKTTRAGLDGFVQFEGTLPSGDPVMRWLDGIDVYVHPSRKEGLPRALVEAMSRGCPAIASTVGGTPELLDRTCLFRPGDAHALGRLLVRAAQDRQCRNEQARRNWERSKAYSRDALEPRRKEFWDEFAAHAARAAARLEKS